MILEWLLSITFSFLKNVRLIIQEAMKSRTRPDFDAKNY
jgi:hypothetical protein